MGQTFVAFRPAPFPTAYPPAPTPVTSDVLEIGLAVAFGAIYFSFLLAVLPGHGIKERIPAIVRTTLLLFLGCSILICQYAYEWQTGSVVTHTNYKPFTKHEIQAEVGLHVGIRGVNITLKGMPQVQRFGNIQNETINYNEHFDWTGQGFSQGRLGFSSQAGQFNQDFIRAQRRGFPLPILAVAEYFTLDGEDIRWGRLHRQAGLYASLVLWLAFGLWGITCFIQAGTVQYGAIFLGLTSSSMIISCILVSAIHQHVGPPLQIPFADGTLALHYGWSYYLCLLTGIVYLLLAAVLYQLNNQYPKATGQFFNMAHLDEEAIRDEQSEEDFDSDSGLEMGMSQQSSQLTGVVDTWESGTGTPLQDTSMGRKRSKGLRSVSQCAAPAIVEEETLLVSGGDSPPRSLASGNSTTESGIGRSPKVSSDTSAASAASADGGVIYANIAHVRDRGS